MRSLAGFCVRRRRLVVLAWAVTLAVVSLASYLVGSQYSDNTSLPHTPSTEAATLLHSVSPAAGGDTELVVFAAPRGERLEDPAVAVRISAVLTRIAAIPHVTGTVSPLAPAGSGGAQLNRKGTVGFATVSFDRPSSDISGAVASRLVRTATDAQGHGLRVAVSGQLAENTNSESLGGAWLGIVLAGVVLLIAFGSLFAMVLPLVTTMASLGTAVAIIALISHAMSVPDFASQLVLLIGLGVGVDYALFIVSRHRQGLMAGVEPEASIITAVNTSGRAVLLAGIIVCVALVGMFTLGVTFLTGMAAAAAIAVLLTMVATLTLLPALLGFIGQHALSRRQRAALAAGGERRPAGRRFWDRWAALVERRPVLPAVAALGLIVLLALPFFALRLGTADAGNDPLGTTTRQAYDLLSEGFGPGFNGPLDLVAAVHDPGQRAALQRVVTAVRRQPGVASIGPISQMPAKDGGDVAAVEVHPTTDPQAGATNDLIARLRHETIPAAARGRVTVYVGGETAELADFANALSAKLPLFVGIVIAASFLLLAIVFRSLVIPLTAAVMNLLSAGAAFGILVAVFEWGWLGTVFGVNRPGPVEAFLPVMLLSILFGLSMDYEVFLVTRIHEEWVVTGDNRLAVRRGLAATGKTITAAAFVMVLVFGSFIFGGQRVIKEFGLGLAAGILVDAIVIRSAIVPSLMLLFGRANWWFPRWLDRLVPHVTVDVPEEDLCQGMTIVDEADVAVEPPSRPMTPV